ncbi:hypothetical protein IMZ11_09345 [Microtetraspora sp. AC03309]|uniref:hypothetical protein n=1 Tax=Microtetraspora sp. AC03309 TaxID=2779376 RepID=UPI001E5A4BF7|nr:hypothetical protein [Microtetraspora sp. AC03309]MCC5575841.1 hypothetical protein [Microtetraspora sp. AC03309]
MGRMVMARVVAVSLVLAGCAATYGNERAPVTVSPSSSVRSPHPSVTPRQYPAQGKFVVDRTQVTRSNGTYTADGVNLSAILVTNSGKLTTTSPQIDKTGDAASNSESGFFGVNSAVLVQSAGTAVISGGSVTTDGVGAIALFAYGQKSSLSMTGGTIEASGEYSRGAIAADRGKVTLARVKVTTSGDHASTVTASRGDGEIVVVGGELSTSGRYSAGAYALGTITCTGARITAAQSEGLVIDGAGSISLKDCLVRGAVGARLYRYTGRRPGRAVLTVNGGRLIAERGDAFQVSSTAALITVKGGARVENSGGLINATRYGQAALVVDGGRLTGDIVTDETSEASVALHEGARLTGRISTAAVALDRPSRWNVTDDSALTALTGAVLKNGVVENIVGNGHDVRYDARLPANAPLAGRTYSLAKGGKLLPRR